VTTAACTGTSDTVCEQIVCEELPAIPGTTLTYSDGFIYPTTAIYTVTCGDDTTTMTRDCQIDGTWTPAGQINACPRSCSEAYEQGAHDDGVYTIVPEGASTAIAVTCDMNQDNGGWTLVYKIAGSSTMATTGALNVEMLASPDAAPQVSMSAKLSDDMIRQLCTEQYRVEQYLSTPTPLYCSFGNVNEYGDGVANTNKQCSTQYDQQAAYPPMNLGQSYSQGFSTWGAITGTTILQLSYQDGRHGSHPCHNCQINHGECQNARCHSRVWCRTEL
jgi:hypothetical protein